MMYVCRWFTSYDSTLLQGGVEMWCGSDMVAEVEESEHTTSLLEYTVGEGVGKETR